MIRSSDFKNFEKKFDTATSFLENIENLTDTIFEDLGPFLPEKAYQTALYNLLKEFKCNVSAEIEIPIIYREQKISSRRVDMGVFYDNVKILIEIKHTVSISDNCFDQISEYMKVYTSLTDLKEKDINIIGVIINFPLHRGKRYKGEKVKIYNPKFLFDGFG